MDENTMTKKRLTVFLLITFLIAWAIFMYMLDKNVKGLYYSPLGYYFFSYCTKTAG